MKDQDPDSPPPPPSKLLLGAMAATFLLMGSAVIKLLAVQRLDSVPVSLPPEAPAPLPILKPAPGPTEEERLLGPEQLPLLRAFTEAETLTLRERLETLKGPSPLARALPLLEAQERRERFLKGLLAPEAWLGHLSSLGPDPFPSLGIPRHALRALPRDRAQALAGHWAKVFEGSVPEDSLRGRAADLVDRMDALRASFGAVEGIPLPLEAERTLHRRLAGLQLEAESALAPRSALGSQGVLDFPPPGP